MTRDKRFVRISSFGLLSDFVIRNSSLPSSMNENSKNQLQTPETLQVPMTKSPNPKEAPISKLRTLASPDDALFGNLGVGIYLELGTWDLELCLPALELSKLTRATCPASTRFQCIPTQTTKSSVPDSGGTARYSGCRTGNVSPLVRCNWKARNGARSRIFLRSETFMFVMR